MGFNGKTLRLRLVDSQTAPATQLPRQCRLQLTTTITEHELFEMYIVLVIVFPWSNFPHTALYL